MSPQIGGPIRLTPRYFWLLLVALMIVLVLAPLFEDSYMGAILLHVGLTAVFVTGVMLLFLALRRMEHREKLLT